MPSPFFCWSKKTRSSQRDAFPSVINRHKLRVILILWFASRRYEKPRPPKNTREKSRAMTDLVQLAKDKDIAIITINNAPVNALSPGVPEGISEALDEITRDANISAAVLIGGGRTFVAGADIKEFGKMTSGKSRGAGLLPLLLKIEDARKPVIVAIHGTAFGGGLELAMAGRYRIAVADAQVGQPAVKLGLTRRGRHAAPAAARGGLRRPSRCVWPGTRLKPKKP